MLAYELMTLNDRDVVLVLVDGRMSLIMYAIHGSFTIYPS
jgi:hypothetical protein